VSAPVVAIDTEWLDAIWPADLLPKGEKLWVGLAASNSPIPGQAGADRFIPCNHLRWPDERDEIVAWMAQYAADHHVFYSPSLFSEPQRRRQACRGGAVAWVDIDHLPTDEEREFVDRTGGVWVESGTPGNAHVYWLLNRWHETDDLFDLNDLLRQVLSGDSKHSPESLLRPPGTLNHKTDPANPVVRVSTSLGARVSPGQLSHWAQEVLPDDVAERIARNRVEGGHDSLRRIAVMAEAADLSPELVEQLVREHGFEINAERLQVGGRQVPMHEIRRIALGAANYHGLRPMNDDGNGLRVADAAMDSWRVVRDDKGGPGQLLQFTGSHWRIASHNQLVGLARHRLRLISLYEAEKAKKPIREEVWKWGQQSLSAYAINAATTLALTDHRLLIDSDALVGDRMLLACPNGTVDLRTGAISDPNPEDMLLNCTAVDYVPHADCPEWEHLVRWAMGEGKLPPEDVDAKVAGFQMHLGYGVTGHVGENNMDLWFGDGRNGKGAIRNVIKRVLGSYCIEIDCEVLMAQRWGQHPTALLDLMGARLVFTTETEQGRMLAEAMFKKLTGGDPITARAMRKDNVTFWPTHTLVMLTNYKPRIRGDSDAVWARLYVWDFPNSISKFDTDKMLEDRLFAQEGKGILAWLVRGAQMWAEAGYCLRPIASVERANTEYRAEQDVVGRFLAEHEIEFPCPVAELWQAWINWSLDEGEKLDPQSFNTAMGKRGYKRTVTKRGGVNTKTWTRK
jgi:putative DNA primase/helicase